MRRRTPASGAEAERYTVQWSLFDNASSSHKNVGSEQNVTGLAGAGALQRCWQSDLRTSACTCARFIRDQPAWSQPLMAYFRRAGEAWSLVGLERN